jgi:protein-S-isoprenylcysteine O-methyltransferase Ste14
MSRTRLWGWVLVTVQLVLLAFVVLAPPRGAWPLPGYLRTFATVVVWLGLAVIVAGALSLGRSIRAHPEPATHAELRTAGLYSVVRHPIYSGVMAFAAGAAIASTNLLAAVAFGALVAILSIKARFEERLLKIRFPEYRSYAERTPRFFPLPRVGR